MLARVTVFAVAMCTAILGIAGNAGNFITVVNTVNLDSSYIEPDNVTQGRYDIYTKLEDRYVTTLVDIAGDGTNGLNFNYYNSDGAQFNTVRKRKDAQLSALIDELREKKVVSKILDVKGLATGNATETIKFDTDGVGVISTLEIRNGENTFRKTYENAFIDSLNQFDINKHSYLGIVSISCSASSCTSTIEVLSIK